MADEKKHLDETPDPENNNPDEHSLSHSLEESVIADIAEDNESIASVDVILEDDNEFDDAIDDTLETLNELNLSIEDETMAVEIIREDDLEDTSTNVVANETALPIDDADNNDTNDDLLITVEDATEPLSALSAEDLALLDDAMLSNDDDEEEEIIIKDFLNEDDGEPLATPDYLKPPEPEWKVVARQLREEREEKRRDLLAKKREDDKRVSEEYDARLKEREQIRKQQETTFRAEREKLEQDKKQAVEDMMQRIRDERERKQTEREQVDQQEFGRKFTYPKPASAPSYPKPSEIKRMEREQPKNEVDLTDTNKPSPPIKKAPENTDLESRLNRLSKPDAPSDTKNDTPDEPDTDNK